MIRFSALCLLALFLASANGFAVLRPGAATPKTQLSLMSQEDSDAFIVKATECIEGGCAVDEVNELVELLKVQKEELNDRLQKVKKMRMSLEKINSKDSREVDEIRDSVRAIFRVFQSVGKGNGTAWAPKDVGDSLEAAFDDFSSNGPSKSDAQP